jgi:hypothetical protein
MQFQERISMPRKPNYKFERMQRDKAKADKKAEKMKARAEKSEQAKAATADVQAQTETD